MKTIQIVGVLLIAAGALGLGYKQISYTKERHEAKIGTLELSFDEKETLSIPVWLSGGVIAIGVVLLVAGARRR